MPRRIGPVLIDKFLEDATEVDVDAVSDGKTTIIGGVMEHIEEAGVHSGDSACSLPPYSLPRSVVEEIKQATYSLARELAVRGLMNIQFAVKAVDGQRCRVRAGSESARQPHEPVCLESHRPAAGENRRQSDGRRVARRTGRRRRDLATHTSVKESVFPFSRFSGVDIILGPEMRSTGEVMGIDEKFPLAFAKSQIAAGISLPTEGTVFISMTRDRKHLMIEPARRLQALGFKIVCTSGTARVLADAGLEVETIRKVQEGRPNLLDKMANGEIQFIFNTPSGKGARTDEGRIRAAAVAYGVPCVTTIPGCLAIVKALEAYVKDPVPRVRALQDWAKMDQAAVAVER